MDLTEHFSLVSYFTSFNKYSFNRQVGNKKLELRLITLPLKYVLKRDTALKKFHVYFQLPLGTKREALYHFTLSDFRSV